MSTPLSLLDVLARVPDPRSRHGRRHPLSAILALAVLAMLSGAKRRLPLQHRNDGTQKTNDLAIHRFYRD